MRCAKRGLAHIVERRGRAIRSGLDGDRAWDLLDPAGNKVFHWVRGVADERRGRGSSAAAVEGLHAKGRSYTTKGVN